ncbi:MAG: AAA family ATPase [Porphyromonas sp.]|uniref:ATP-dependent DNA helicase n=1 Tax=Porphyromonas sp. TaxID=1924944 RepID=UPI002A760885|nr:AAA family ATPase [Porphyromonas sp.]MDY3111334.1 AAA family ATPase [Porphyromonas sp.]
MILTTEQAQALEEMKSFVAAPQENIFILKGYAGTGKTTLLSVLLDYLDSQRISYDLMAPTGRAAKVMRDKLKRGASTIHSRIYKYVAAIKVKDAQKDTYHRLYYTVDEARYGSVIIVDEGSMVSIKKQLDEIYVMGSGSLLEDILTYAGVQSHRAKIIFVGDPAQLPPVGENEPVALQRETFESRGLRVMESWLREVVRQASGSLILANATQMRRFIEEGHGVVMPEYDDHSFQRVEALDLLSCYFRLFPKNNLDNGPIITYSNRSCLELNQAIRERYFPNHPNVTGGDKLLVVKNNQFHNLVNGDFVEVVWASPRTESHTISLKEENVTLTFRDLQIKTDEGTYQVKILDDLLSSPQANITSSESKALFKKVRLDAYQAWGLSEKGKFRPKEEGVSIPEEEYQRFMRSDKYFNALHCKYGYAVTCHKSQGGEWDTVLVDYEGRNQISVDAMRWAYTATTRASQHCIVTNPPQISESACYRGVQATNALSKPPTLPSASTSQKSEGDDDVDLNILLQGRTTAPLPEVQRMFATLSRALAHIGYEIISTKAMQYQERYTIRSKEGGGPVEISGFYNKQGAFRPGFKITAGVVSPDQRALLDPLLASPEHSATPTPQQEQVVYPPSSTAYELAYGIVSRASERSGVSIRAVQEYPAQYYVRYYLATAESPDAYLDCFCNAKGYLTKIIPYLYGSDSSGRFDLFLSEIKGTL